MATYLYTGAIPVRDGVRGVAPWGFYPCSDGFVLLQITEDPQWFNLRRIIGEPEWAQPDVFDTTAMRTELHDVIDPLLEEALQAFTVEEFLDACQREGVRRGAGAGRQRPVDVAAPPRPQLLHARSSSRPRPDHEVVAPTPPWRFASTPPAKVARISPASAPTRLPWSPTGSHVAAPPSARRPRARAGAVGRSAGDRHDLGVGRPVRAMQLAHLGAEVIKFESTTASTSPAASARSPTARSGSTAPATSTSTTRASAASCSTSSTAAGLAVAEAA